MSTRAATFASALGAAVLVQAQGPALEPVRQSELAFARMAGERGIRAAFVAWLTEEARVFTPRMTTAKVQYGREPGDSGHLAWYPEAMGLAASGELAWSLGPWAYAAEKGEAPRAHGHFLSVWRRQSDGRWRVVADIGVPHAAPDRPIEPFETRQVPVPAPPTPALPDAGSLLRRLEAGLAEAWSTQGGMALGPHLAKEARILRPGGLPRRGEAIWKALAADRPGPGREPAVLEVAASGDLAWTCGETGSGPGAASFLRIWILESGIWKVLFDVRLPHPSSTK